MPRKIHNGPTVVLPVRMEISDLNEIDKLLRRLARLPRAAEKPKYGHTRNSIVVAALKKYLAEN